MVAGIIQLPSLVMVGDHLRVILTTYGRMKLLMDLRPAIWYWDSTSSIVDLWCGKRVHHFLIVIEVNQHLQRTCVFVVSHLAICLSHPLCVCLSASVCLAQPLFACL